MEMKYNCASLYECLHKVGGSCTPPLCYLTVRLDACRLYFGMQLTLALVGVDNHSRCCVEHWNACCLVAGPHGRVGLQLITLTSFSIFGKINIFLFRAPNIVNNMSVLIVLTSSCNGIFQIFVWDCFAVTQNSNFFPTRFLPSCICTI